MPHRGLLTPLGWIGVVEQEGERGETIHYLGRRWTGPPSGYATGGRPSRAGRGERHYTPGHYAR